MVRSYYEFLWEYENSAFKEKVRCYLRYILFLLPRCETQVALMPHFYFVDIVSLYGLVDK